MFTDLARVMGGSRFAIGLNNVPWVLLVRAVRGGSCSTVPLRNQLVVLCASG